LPIQPLVQPEQVLVPPTGFEQGVSDYLTITRFPIDNPNQFQSVSVMGRMLELHVSRESVFVMTSRQAIYTPSSFSSPTSGLTYSTDVHQFQLDTNGFAFRGSGVADGAIGGSGSARSTWRFNEHEGRFRIITAMPRLGSAQSRLTIMEPSLETTSFLRTVSTLPNKVRNTPIGKPNEELYGTRFLGNRLYAVTFRRVDPLYVVDLRTRLPRVVMRN
jgi:hypothetical protein